MVQINAALILFLSCGLLIFDTMPLEAGIVLLLINKLFYYENTTFTDSYRLWNGHSGVGGTDSC